MGNKPKKIQKKAAVDSDEEEFYDWVLEKNIKDAAKHEFVSSQKGTAFYKLNHQS
jgi:hypothetical protein